MVITIQVTSGKHTGTFTLPRDAATANRVADLIRDEFVVPEGADVPAVTYEDDEGDSISLNLGVTVEFDEALRVMEATSSPLRFKLAEALAPREKKPEIQAAAATLAPPAPAVAVVPPTVKFERDLTIPNGSHLATGKPFVKTWLVSTPTGWSSGTVLRCLDMWSAFTGLKQAVPSVPAGSQAEMSITLMAPADVGHYRSYWALAGPDGRQFGDVLFVNFNAVAEADSGAGAGGGGAEKPALATTATTTTTTAAPAAPATAPAHTVPVAVETADVVCQISALLQSHAAGMAKRVADLEGTLAKETCRANATEALVDSLSKSQETLRTSLSAERHTTAALREEVGSLRADKLALAAERQALATVVEQQTAEKKGLVDTIVEQREALSTKQLEVQDLQKEAAALREQLEAVYAKIAGLLPGTTADARPPTTNPFVSVVEQAVQDLEEFSGTVEAVADATRQEITEEITEAAAAPAAAPVPVTVTPEDARTMTACRLIWDMGFDDVCPETVSQLLEKHSGDVNAVVQELLSA
jgi:hypothetical protein